MVLQESGEMYLETILILSAELPKVRSIDISKQLGYSKPSVSHAMKLLCEEKYVRMESDGSIQLTISGKAIADRIYERHQVLTHFLSKLGVNRTLASEDACRIEHVISAESFAALKKYMEKNLQS